MKFTFIIAGVLSLAMMTSCKVEKDRGKPEELFKEPVSALYDSTLKPFYHGVASGDPASDGVLLWTRVTPETQQGKNRGFLGSCPR